jgi:hypothetical protein
MQVAAAHGAKIQPVRAAEQQASDDADGDLDVSSPRLVTVNGRESQHDDTGGPEHDDAGAPVDAETHAETGDAGRDDEPKHKSMKMLVFSERDRGDRQKRHEQGNRKAVDDADRRQGDSDLIEVPRMLHRPLVSSYSVDRPLPGRRGYPSSCMHHSRLVL